MEALVSGHPRDAKKVPVPGAGRLRECKKQSLYESWEKQSFKKVAVSKAVILRGRLLGEPPLYTVLMLLAL